jgi:antibiotic biosynthesis monooxygenase (ABM) superfamily enzyme
LTAATATAQEEEEKEEKEKVKEEEAVMDWFGRSGVARSDLKTLLLTDCSLFIVSLTSYYFSSLPE